MTDDGAEKKKKKRGRQTTLRCLARGVLVASGSVPCPTPSFIDRTSTNIQEADIQRIVLEESVSSA